MKDITLNIDIQKIQDIEERSGLATPGPWKSVIEGRDQDSGSSFIGTAGDDINFYGLLEQDQDFIANARQDVPYLLSEIKRIRDLSTQTASLFEHGQSGGNISSGIDLNKLRVIEQYTAKASEAPWRSVAQEPRPSFSLSQLYIAHSIIITANGTMNFLNITTADRDFIAYARQDIPYLLRLLKSVTSH